MLPRSLLRLTSEGVPAVLLRTTVYFQDMIPINYLTFGAVMAWEG